MPDSGDVTLKKKGKLTAEVLKKLADDQIQHITLSDPDEQKQLEEIERLAKEQIEILQTLYDDKVGRLKRGDELPPGVIKLVKVYIAMKRKISVGDKMAGRHGNKGVGLADPAGRRYAVSSGRNAGRDRAESVGRAVPYECRSDSGDASGMGGEGSWAFRCPARYSTAHRKRKSRNC